MPPETQTIQDGSQAPMSGAMDQTPQAQLGQDEMVLIPISRENLSVIGQTLQFLSSSIQEALKGQGTAPSQDMQMNNPEMQQSSKDKEYNSMLNDMIPANQR